MDEECYICCDTFTESNIKGEQQVILKCGHKFHYNCIVMSYKKARNKLCPYCRQPGGKIIVKETINYCKAIIGSGPYKGCVCKIKAKYNGYCGRHKNKFANLLIEN